MRSATQRSAQIDLSRYDTDKVANRYLESYDPMLERFVDAGITLLEIGVHRGGSLRLWRDYFPNGIIVGIDKHIPPGLESEERIRVFEGRQEDTAFLSRVAGETAPQGFDVVIDDASHVGEPTKIAFWHLFGHHLKPSGLYVIEDWGTGYWDDWADGRTVRPEKRSTRRDRAPKGGGVRHPSHDYGMVGFVKQLVDEQGAADLTRASLRGSAARRSRFARVVITPSIVFVEKAS